MSSIYSDDNEISSDNNSFNLNDEEQSINDQTYVGKIEFEGMDTIWTYNTDKDCDIKISYLLSVNSGKAKLVLISPDGNLNTIVENKDNTIQKDMDTIKISLKKGKNRIKLVAADKAQIDMKLQINVGKINELGF